MIATNSFNTYEPCLKRNVSIITAGGCRLEIQTKTIPLIHTHGRVIFATYFLSDG